MVKIRTYECIDKLEMVMERECNLADTREVGNYPSCAASAKQIRDRSKQMVAPSHRYHNSHNSPSISTSSAWIALKVSFPSQEASLLHGYVANESRDCC